jgi:Rad3-related DNA helicase
MDYPLLVQGTAPRSDLLEKFRKLGNAVLLGTSSFWEGVDVRGSALSCVIIDKLPFASPGDPVLQARIEAMRSQGKNPFIEYQLPNAVLLGTSSFWEGVDVRGSALSCVIIDKLPFASPGDPVLQARIDAMRSQGKNPFIEYQLPNAVIALKQGVGRLIRDIDDRGVLVLCDPRLRSKSYGRVFLNSLPDMPLTQAIDAVHEFYAGVDFTVTQSLDMEHTL